MVNEPIFHHLAPFIWRWNVLLSKLSGHWFDYLRCTTVAFMIAVATISLPVRKYQLKLSLPPSALLPCLVLTKALSSSIHLRYIFEWASNYWSKYIHNIFPGLSLYIRKIQLPVYKVTTQKLYNLSASSSGEAEKIIIPSVFCRQDFVFSCILLFHPQYLEIYWSATVIHKKSWNERLLFIVFSV